MNAHLRKCPWLGKTGEKKAKCEVSSCYRVAHMPSRKICIYWSLDSVLNSVSPFYGHDLMQNLYLLVIGPSPQLFPPFQTIIRNVYRCKICNFAVTHKRGTIAGHMKQRHKMNIIEYSAEYESGQ